MSRKPNNSSDAKSVWVINRRNYGSKRMKIHESKLSSRKHFKSYKAKQGKFSTRTLQSLAGKKWRRLATKGNDR